MQEILNSRSSKRIPFFRLSFEDKEVGTTGFVPESTLPWNFVRTTQNTPTDGVVDHPTYGKCYRLDGNAVFRDPVNRLNMAMMPYFRLEVDYVSDVAYAQFILTGSDSSLKSGWNLYTSTIAGKWLHAIFRSASSTLMSSGAGTPPVNSLRKISITKDGTSVEVKDITGNVSNTWNLPGGNTGPDSFMCLCSTETGFGGAMKGYLKRFEIFDKP